MSGGCDACDGGAEHGRTPHSLCRSRGERSGQHLKWGLIGDMDLVRVVHRGAFSEAAATIAATEPIAVRGDDSLERVAELMVEHATSHVVVVARSGLPSGIVSTRDVAGVLASTV